MSQLIRVCSEETMSKERAEKERREEGGDTAVSFSDRRMCIPGDNRVNVLGLYSVQVMRRQTHCERQEQHFHHSP